MSRKNRVGSAHTRIFLEDANPEDQQPPDPESLLQGVFFRLGRGCERAERNGERHKLAGLLRERWLIVSWLYPALYRSFEDPYFLKYLHESGFTAQQVEQCRTISQQRRRGRPVTPDQGRNFAVKALKRKWREPRITFRKIIEEGCPCGKRNHDESCTQNLLRQTRAIKSFLKKHGSPIRPASTREAE